MKNSNVFLEIHVDKVTYWVYFQAIIDIFRKMHFSAISSGAMWKYLLVHNSNVVIPVKMRGQPASYDE